MKICHICGQEVEIKLDFGLQPVCNKFLKSPDEAEYKHFLSMGICSQCALVQLIEHPSAMNIKPKYRWINYSEPEKHLDETAERIASLLKNGSKIIGLTDKDKPLIEKLRNKGFEEAFILSEHLGIEEPYGMEMVQEALNLEKAKEIVLRNGKFDFIIVRHIFEHVHNFKEFNSAIKEMLNPEGIVMFEVPDYTRNFEKLDYSSIWEEHTVYFTPKTFRNSLQLSGYKLISLDNFVYTMENCLVAIAKVGADKIILEGLDEEKRRAEYFFSNFPTIKQELQDWFEEENKKGKVAIFGAGHTAAMLINIMELKEFITCFVDDNENKKSLFMPGSRLPIKGSSVLNEIKLCLFCLNPEVEDKIMTKNSSFSGEFKSLSPASKYYLLNSYGFDNSDFSEYNEEVYYPVKEVVKLKNKEVNVLQRKAKFNERKRCRICTHKDSKDQVHEMIITLRQETYVRPHKHLQKSESFHIIEGSAMVVLFEDNGSIKEIIEMGEYNSGKNFYYRLNGSSYHTVIITSPYLIFHETTKGPFDRNETIFALWSPDEDKPEEGRAFLHNLIGVRK